jgi:glycosyltransferase involved in cell wall biosynthesis
MKMQICMITTSYPRYNGDFAGNFTHNLAKELARSGIAVRVVAPHDVTTKDHEWIDSVEIYRFSYWFRRTGQKVAYGVGMPDNIKTSLLARIQLPLFMLFFFLNGLSVARNCNLIHAHYLPSGFVGFLITKLTGQKLIVTAHGSDIYMIPERGLFQKRYIRALSNASVIITVSHANKERLLKLGLPRDKIIVIPNGIDLALFDTTVSTLKGHEDEVHIMWVGRMVEVKGLEYLIHAMRIVVTRYPQSKLILIGTGPLKAKLERLVGDLSLDKNITFTGSVNHSDVPLYLKEADIFVLPSLSEGFPVVILEAMAAGKPVVASNVRGIPDAVTDGVTGFLVEPENYEQLAEKIVYLIEHPEEGERMGKAGRKLVEERFTWAKIAEEIIRIYKSKLC